MGDIHASYKNFPHPAIIVGYDPMRQNGPTLLFIAAAFNFVVQMYLIVEEKEHKLRYAMEKVGMYDSMYWLTWYLFDCVVNFIVVIFLIAFGAMFQLELFLETDFMILFLHFWLCANAFTAAGFFMAAPINKIENATSLGLLYFIEFYLTLLGQVVQRIHTELCER